MSKTKDFDESEFRFVTNFQHMQCNVLVTESNNNSTTLKELTYGLLKPWMPESWCLCIKGLRIICLMFAKKHEVMRNQELSVLMLTYKSQAEQYSQVWLRVLQIFNFPIQAKN